MTLSPYYAPDVADTSVTAQAFESLSSTSRSLLWYMDIERLTLREVSQLVGVDASKTIALTARARYEFRIAWLKKQATSERVPAACKHITQLVSTTHLNALSQFNRDRVQTHLTNCMRCTILVEELDNLHAHLGLALLPMVLGPRASAATS